MGEGLVALTMVVSSPVGPAVPTPGGPCGPAGPAGPVAPGVPARLTPGVRRSRGRRAVRIRRRRRRRPARAGISRYRRGHGEPAGRADPVLPPAARARTWHGGSVPPWGPGFRPDRLDAGCVRGVIDVHGQLLRAACLSQFGHRSSAGTAVRRVQRGQCRAGAGRRVMMLQQDPAEAARSRRWCSSSASGNRAAVPYARLAVSQLGSGPTARPQCAPLVLLPAAGPGPGRHLLLPAEPVSPQSPAAQVGEDVADPVVAVALGGRHVEVVGVAGSHRLRRLITARPGVSSRTAVTDR